jgi:hypothetical protein
MPHPSIHHPWRRPAVFVCVRRPPRSKPRRCVVCKGKGAVFLCDGPGKHAGETCDAALCARCRHRPDAAQNLDYCPKHRESPAGKATDTAEAAEATTDQRKGVC